MMKIFKSRKDVKIFAVLIALIVFMLLCIVNVMKFEKNWYNIDYEEYKKNPDEYIVAEVTIKDFELCTGKNYKAISIVDRYYTALVDVTYAGGQTETCRIPRDNGDEIGSTVKVAYDKRYDTEYEKMKKATEDVDKGYVGEIARTDEVTFNRYSTTLIVIEAILMLVTILYVMRCSKKEKAKMFFE